ncbi:uncharacterized protein LOC107694406 [Sinocyclocheilus anshuiensis]|uniref:uncharacterized protein LOC107694406 n=1 Tax=Sinocyclocheilus anshuiensis TaxID=1608454 RepID=UPI0007B98EE5|nr:PREDICTED: uncharacterized protein LOC107694406 [Sinocyclocheilus anshuiensis]
MSFSMWVFTVLFISMEDLVNGDELKTVMEGDVLTLQTRDTESLSEVTWLFKRGDQTVRIAQMYQGYEPFYEETLTGRVKMNPKTGALTIWNISSSDSGLYQVSLHSGSVSEKRIRVDVYRPVSVPVIRSPVGVNQTQGETPTLFDCSFSRPQPAVQHMDLRRLKTQNKKKKGSLKRFRINLTQQMSTRFIKAATEDGEVLLCVVFCEK